MSINFKCENCGKQYSVPETSAGKRGKCKNCGVTIQVPIISPSKKGHSMQRYNQYKVITVEEGGCGTLLVGSSMIPVNKMEKTLNQYVAEGWQVVFQIIEKRRYLLFWTRESVVITLGR